MVRQPGDDLARRQAGKLGAVGGRHDALAFLRAQLVRGRPRPPRRQPPVRFRCAMFPPALQGPVAEPQHRAGGFQPGTGGTGIAHQGRLRQGFLHAPQRPFQLRVAPRRLPVVGGTRQARTQPVGPGAGFPPSRQLLWEHTPATAELPRLLFIEGGAFHDQMEFLLGAVRRSGPLAGVATAATAAGRFFPRQP